MSKICSNKKCTHKGKPQEVTNFYKCHCRPDGLTDDCKTCRKKRQKVYAEKQKEVTKNKFAMFIG